MLKNTYLNQVFAITYGIVAMELNDSGEKHQNVRIAMNQFGGSQS
jgi:hypothetical protein